LTALPFSIFEDILRTRRELYLALGGKQTLLHFLSVEFFDMALKCLAEG
jgi:hypothetical protein